MQAKTGRWLTGAVIAVIALYALAGFVLAPGIIHQRLVAALGQETGLDVAIGSVVVNPFTLSVVILKVEVGDAGGAPFAGTEQVTARLRPGWMFGRGWRADDVQISAPKLILPTFPDWSDRLIRMLSGRGNLDLRRVNAVDGVLEIVADGQPTLRFSDLELTLGQLRNGGGTDGGGQAGRFLLSAVQGDSGVIAASGALGLAPARLDAELSADRIDISPFDWSLSSATNLLMSSQTLASEGRIRIQDRQMTFAGDVQLTGLTLRDTGGHLLTARSVSATSVNTNTGLSATRAELLRISGAQLDWRRAPDKRAAPLHRLRPLVFGSSGIMASVARVELEQGLLAYTDPSMSPPVHFKIMDVAISAGRDGQQAAGTVVSGGRLLPAGAIHIETRWLVDGAADGADGDTRAGDARAGEMGRLTDWRYTAEAVDVRPLSPYLLATTGHEAIGGTLSLSGQGSIDERGIRSDDLMVAQDLGVVRQDQHQAAAGWNLRAAFALLEDGAGQIRLDLPAATPAGEHHQSFTELVLQKFRQRTTDLASRPFEALGEMIELPVAGLAQVKFPAGSAALTPAASQQLSALATALSRRPRLGIEVGGRFGPTADRAELAREQMRLHIALATSAGPPGRGAGSEVDFGDSRVIGIIEEFATERLPPTQLATIRSRHSSPGAGLYQALFEALVNNETVAPRALTSLARYRARTVVSQLTALDIAPHRLIIGPAGPAMDQQEVAESAVATELTMRYDLPAPDPEDPN